jgi:hypothetical protein
MEAVLSLLRTIVGASVGFFVALGSFFTPQIVATNPPPALIITHATSTPAQAKPEQMGGGASSTPAKVSSQKSSGLLSKPPVSRGGSAGQTFAQTPLPSLPIEQINAAARAAIVNIFCTTKSGGYFNPISGSGVIIDSRGVILTNAHVAQYFLLPDYVQCLVRTGSPAQARYTARLMYLPPAWIAANAGEISSSTPSGTGEYDYAFLYITGTTDPNGTLPATFPALPMDGADPSTGQQVVLAAYPAGFLGGVSITLNLYATSAVASVGDIFAFVSGSHADLFSLGGTVVSQSGSSGGGAINGQGKLQGIISTEVPAATTAGRDLRAITIGYINRQLEADGQGGLLGFLSNDLGVFADAFAKTVAPVETKALVNALSGQ